jgi:GH15 family glucan-1,4-alpha-glucosidase
MSADSQTLNDLANQYAAAVVAYRAANQAASIAANALGNATRAAGEALLKPGASTADIIGAAAAQAALARAKSAHDTAVANAANALQAQTDAWSALLAAS